MKTLSRYFLVLVSVFFFVSNAAAEESSYSYAKYVTEDVVKCTITDKSEKYFGSTQYTCFTCSSLEAISADLSAFKKDAAGAPVLRRCVMGGSELHVSVSEISNMNLGDELIVPVSRKNNPFFISKYDTEAVLKVKDDAVENLRGQAVSLDLSTQSIVIEAEATEPATKFKSDLEALTATVKGVSEPIEAEIVRESAALPVKDAVALEPALR